MHEIRIPIKQPDEFMKFNTAYPDSIPPPKHHKSSNKSRVSIFTQQYNRGTTPIVIPHIYIYVYLQNVVKDLAYKPFTDGISLPQDITDHAY